MNGKELREQIIDIIIEKNTPGQTADKIIELFKTHSKENNFMYIGD